MGKSEVSYELAHKMFSYNPDTGIVTRKISVSSRARARDELWTVNCSGYIVVRFEGKLHYVHRIIWLMQTGEWPTLVIDHIDGNGANNKWTNIRHVTYSVNLQNKIVESGVYWSKRDKVWVATMQVDGRRQHIGQHKSKIIAEAMYKQAKLAYVPRLTN